MPLLQGGEAWLYYAPNVIMAGKMRDRENITIVLGAADRGPLVLGHMHTHNVVMATNWTVNVFPAKNQHQIHSIRGRGAEDFTSLDMHLAQLARFGKITQDPATGS